MGSWASRGMEEAFEHLSDGRSGGVTFTPDFFLSKGDKNVLIQLVDREPFNCYVHGITKVSKKGNQYTVFKTCSHDDECYYCEASQSSMKGVAASTWRSHLTVLDSRMWPYKREGSDEEEEPGNWTRRLWRASAQRITPLLQMRGIQKRGRLDGAYAFVTRLGSGFDTIYTYEYVTKKAVGLDKDLSTVVKDLGWNPMEQKFAPCPEMDKVVPFNYEELLKPDSYDEAVAFLTHSSGGKVEKEEDEEDDNAVDELVRSVTRKATKKRRVAK